VTHLVGPVDTGSAQQTNLVWSNRVFTTRSDFAGWLVSRGSNYELWSQRHPAAARHFDDVSRRSLAASSSAQDSRGYAQSRTALLITIISCSLLLALLALPKFVRSAGFLLDLPNFGLRLRGPPLAIVAIERARAKTHASYAPTSALIEGAARFDWREGWSGLRRLARVTADRAAEAANFDSRVVRRYLPRVVFYTTAVVLSFAIGAWVAIYL
jgi:hypothetical protein